MRKMRSFFYQVGTFIKKENEAVRLILIVIGSIMAWFLFVYLAFQFDNQNQHHMKEPQLKHILFI